MNGNWYVVKKGRIYRVHSCVPKHGWKVVGVATERFLAVRLMWQKVGEAKGLLPCW